MGSLELQWSAGRSSLGPGQLILQSLGLRLVLNGEWGSGSFKQFLRATFPSVLALSFMALLWVPLALVYAGPQYSVLPKRNQNSDNLAYVWLPTLGLHWGSLHRRLPDDDCHILGYEGGALSRRPLLSILFSEDAQKPKTRNPKPKP